LGKVVASLAGLTMHGNVGLFPFMQGKGKFLTMALECGCTHPMFYTLIGQMAGRKVVSHQLGAGRTAAEFHVFC
jgi:hypothetical protein